MPAFGSIIWNVLALLLDDDMGLFLGDSAMALPRSLFLDRRDFPADFDRVDGDFSRVELRRPSLLFFFSRV